MNVVRVKAYAKVNLTLEIVGEKDGYHLLDSLVTSVDLFDLLVVKKRKGKLSQVMMHGRGSESIPPENNNALKAAEAFSERFGVDGVSVTVYKNIPMGAGLGGSSADIAGVLSAMQKLYGVTDDNAVAALADALGSDVRFMLKGGYARMSGRGEIVEKLSGKLPKLHMLLLCPSEGVSAGACYKRYDETDKPIVSENTAACIKALQKGDIESVGKVLCNHLLEPAKSLCKAVGVAVEEAESFSPLGTCMTGSGSCAFALFENREFCEWAKSRYKGKFSAYVVETVDPIEEKKGWAFPFALRKEEQV